MPAIDDNTKNLSMENNDDDENDMLSDEVAPRRLRRAETVLRNRTGRIVLVLPHVTQSFHQQAMIRTAESLGIQYIYTLRPQERTMMSKAIMKGSKNWVSLVQFDSIEALTAACKEEGEMWVLSPNHHPVAIGSDSTAVPLPLAPAMFADTAHRRPAPASDRAAVEAWQAAVVAQRSAGSQSLLPPPPPALAADASVFGFPARLHLVVADDDHPVPDGLHAAADRHVFMPKYGFNASGLAPSVALAIVLDRLFLLCPSARGSLTASQREEVRRAWYAALASTPRHVEVYTRWLAKADTIPLLGELRIEKKKVPMMGARLRNKLQLLQQANARAVQRATTALNTE